jgi:predicted ferric reductase
MKSKSTFGWIIIILISLIPMFLLFGLGPQKNFDYSDITHTLGQITGLVGMTLFALTFLLSTRLEFIENLFGGLDRVYKTHSILGSIALSLLLFHPILLVLKFIPNNISLAATYLLPGTDFSVNYGIIALLGMVLLIYLTFFSKLKYHAWKFTHEFFGLFFLFAVLHVFLVRDNIAQDYIFKGYFAYAIIVSFIGFVSFIYSLIIRRGAKRRLYSVESIKKPTEDIYDITLAHLDKPIEYNAGQFVFVSFFNKKTGGEHHPFSIASKSNNANIRIIIKNLGDFTSRLDNLRKGDKVRVEGPYGRFNKQSKADQIWIAGGIGITPFMGMAEDMAEKTKNHVDLFYSAKEQKEFANAEEFREIEKKNPNFHFFTKTTSKEGYLSAKEIIEKSGPVKDKEAYICGPEAFKEAIKKGLIDEGIHEDKIYWEEFNFR